MANVATNDRVGREELDAFLRTRHKAIVVTRRTDGGDQTSPVTLGIDAEGRLLVSTYPERAKVANVRRDPRVAMCVLSDDFDGPWVHVEGTAEILDMPDALDPLVEYFRSISGESTRGGRRAAATTSARRSAGPAPRPPLPSLRSPTRRPRGRGAPSS